MMPDVIRRLSCLVLTAALVAMIGTVVVEFDFDIGLYEFTVARQAELHVLDVEATGYPHAFVIRLDAGCLLK